MHKIATFQVIHEMYVNISKMGDARKAKVNIRQLYFRFEFSNKPNSDTILFLSFL